MAQPSRAETPSTAAEPGSDPLLQVRDLTQEFVARGRGGARVGRVRAVSRVSFDLGVQETLGVVGETGSGKSTLARSILLAPPPTGGSVVFRGVELTAAGRRELAEARRQMQIVFQDPFSSIDPTWRVEQVVEEPLLAAKVRGAAGRRRRVAELLELVGLDPARYGKRHSWELSGGQCQRVAIARAVALNPALVICDEAVSALDVIVQSQVLALFQRLQRELGLSYLFIAHNLELVRRVADRVAVMYLGRLCEVGPIDELYQRPAHPYTVALLAAIPRRAANGERSSRPELTLTGEVPSPLAPPSGCRFRTRCPLAEARCAQEVPELRPVPDGVAGHHVACHFPVSGQAAKPGHS